MSCGRRRAKRAPNAPRPSARVPAPASPGRPAVEPAYLAGNSSTSLTLTWPGASAVDVGGALLIHTVMKLNALVESLSTMCACFFLSTRAWLRGTHAVSVIDVGAVRLLVP